VRLQNAEHAAIGGNDAHFRDANAMIDSNLIATLLLARVEPRECHSGYGTSMLE
jgi:hypothetical protein